MQALLNECLVLTADETIGVGQNGDQRKAGQAREKVTQKSILFRLLPLELGL